uniref:SCAN box domain-containing protein n=1 Tax=Pygocentrus nattereri TaxID=42514 RepID=A0AAR2KGK1_PYGNA
MNLEPSAPAADGTLRSSVTSLSTDVQSPRVPLPRHTQSFGPGVLKSQFFRWQSQCPARGPERGRFVPAGETPKETYHRLKGLYHRWVKPEEHSKEEIGEIIILELFLRVLPTDVCTWVQEHEPANGLVAAQLAQQSPPREQRLDGHLSSVPEQGPPKDTKYPL